MRKSVTKASLHHTAVWFLLFFCLSVNAASPSFVSLTLCSDRLLMALSNHQQIAALSPFSRDRHAMLGAVDTTIPIVRPTLSDLLPYLQSTILINQHFYPQLAMRLQQLGFNTVSINDSPQNTQQLYQLIRRLGQLTGNPDKAEQLILQMPAPATLATAHLQSKRSALLLSENGLLDSSLPGIQTLYQLIGYQAPANQQHPVLSLETLLRQPPDKIIAFRYGAHYSDGGQLLTHPALKSLNHNQAIMTLPVKYTYCFDHGIWQVADKIKNNHE